MSDWLRSALDGVDLAIIAVAGSGRGGASTAGARAALSRAIGNAAFSVRTRLLD
ncbi:MAG: hypothetical protein N3B15_05180 [Planctomycetota bacterium]|nr:hypothetical protein [Planctomycetota bacterium]